MGKCIYCGKTAGLFSDYHAACLEAAEKQRDEGVLAVKGAVSAFLEAEVPHPGSAASQIASKYKLSPTVFAGAVLGGVDEVARHEPLERQKGGYLIEMCEEVLGKPETLQRDSTLYYPYEHTLYDVELSSKLWEAMHGIVADRISNPCGVVLQPGEARLITFGTVMYRKSVTVSSFSGGYNGVGVRLASGVYYRFGGFGGEAAPVPRVRNVDLGPLIVTNRCMYLAGQQTTFRISYSSALRFRAYPDGLGLFRAAGDGREEIFTVVDGQYYLDRSVSLVPVNPLTLQVGWFLYNVAQFLAAPAQGA